MPILIVVLLILLIPLSLLMYPWNVSSLESNPNPVKNYTEAVERIEILRSQQTGETFPVCSLKFLTHGEKAERVVVLIHGYTSCPEQFHELGKRLHERGANVLIAPLPHHGLVDPMTEELEKLTSEELVQYTDETLDIAQGLGDEVVISGISLGGVLSSWAAHSRGDVDVAVAIAPAFGFQELPKWLAIPAMNLYRILPAEYMWWNPETKLDEPPYYSYPRFPKSGLARMLCITAKTKSMAKRSALHTKRMVVILNNNDGSVDNTQTQEVISQWKKLGANVETFEIPAERKLGHDIISPEQPFQQIDYVYGTIIDLIEK